MSRTDAYVNKCDHRKTHPTEKPIQLVRWCLRMYPSAETVLDPFAGTGSTLVAAAVEHRRAIGIEIDERYCEIAAKRLQQRVMFGVTP